MKNFDYKKFLAENKLTADSRNMNEMNLYNLGDLPSDVEWQEGGIEDMGTDNPLGAEPSEREGYDVQVFGYSPSTDKSYEGLAAGSYGETDFDTIDNIEEIPNKRNPYYPGNLGENIFNSPQMGGITSSSGTAGYINNTSQMDKEYSDSVRRGMFVVEKPNGDVIKYFVSEKGAMDFIDRIDPDGMRDLNIRKV